MEKKIITITLLILLILLFPNALYAINMETEVNKREIESGEEVVIVVKIKDIEVEAGINSIQGQIIYDKVNWEQITSESIKGKNNWSIVYNEEEGKSEGKFILINLEGTKEEEKIFEVRLKAKNKLINTEAKVEIVDLYTTDGENMISIEEISEIINIKANKKLVIAVVTLVIIISTAIISIIIKNKKREKVNR